jgi:hypothetical protein
MEVMPMKKISITRKELEAFAMKALGIRDTALRRMSTLFLAQLLQINLSGEKSASEMADEIQYLENLYSDALPGITHSPGRRRLSDAWIVFKRFNGTNYYLTLAKINEGDRRINQRLRDAYALDFPFLKEKYRFN